LEARNTTAFAISSGVPSLPSGTRFEIIFRRWRPASEVANKSLQSGTRPAIGHAPTELAETAQVAGAVGRRLT